MPETHTVAERHAHKKQVHKEKVNIVQNLYKLFLIFRSTNYENTIKNDSKTQHKTKKSKIKSSASYFLQPKSKKTGKKTRSKPILPLFAIL